MASLDDILGKKRKSDTDERVDLNGLCEECYWPMDHGFYNDKKKTMRIICLNGHERTIEWDMGG